MTPTAERTRPRDADPGSHRTPLLWAACSLAVLRVAMGATFGLAPARAGRLLVGEDAARPAARLFIAAFGARDMLLGLGVLRSLARRESPRSWIATCAAADTLDAFACVALRRGLGSRFAARSFLASVAPALPEIWFLLTLDTREPTDHDNN